MTTWIVSAKERNYDGLNKLFIESGPNSYFKIKINKNGNLVYVQLVSDDTGTIIPVPADLYNIYRL